MKKKIISGCKGHSAGAKTLSHTIPEVYVIESLPRRDNGGVQGKALTTVLTAYGQYPRYRDVVGLDELRSALEDFKYSKYRYLHLSCHGVESGIELRDGTKVGFEELAKLLSGLKLTLRRLFLSACGAGSRAELAEKLFSTKGGRALHSVLAPTVELDLNEALSFWVSFYGGMHMHDESSMKDRDIAEMAQLACNCCRREFAFRSYESVGGRLCHWQLTPKDPEVSDPVKYPITKKS